MPSDTGFWPTLKRHVKNGHLRAAGTEILVGAVVLLVAGMILVGANVSELHTLNEMTQRSNAALLEVAEVDSMTVGVEFAVRGLALTRDPTFRTYHRTNERNLRLASGRLAALIADRPDEVRVMAELKPMLERHIALYDRLAAIGGEHPDEVARVVADFPTRAYRDRMLRRLYIIRDDELRLSDERHSQAMRKVRQTYVLAVGIVMLAFLLAVVGFVLVRGGADAPPRAPGGDDGLDDELKPPVA